MGVITYDDARACARDFLAEEKRHREYCAKWMRTGGHDNHPPIHLKVVIKDIPLSGVTHMRHPDVPSWHKHKIAVVPVVNTLLVTDVDGLKRRIAETGELEMVYHNGIGAHVIYQRVRVRKFEGFGNFYSLIHYHGPDKALRQISYTETGLSQVDYHSLTEDEQLSYTTVVSPRTPFRYSNTHYLDKIFGATSATRMLVEFIEQDGDSLQWEYSADEVTDAEDCYVANSVNTCAVIARPSGWKRPVSIRTKPDVQKLYDTAADWFVVRLNNTITATDYLTDRSLRDRVEIIPKIGTTGRWLQRNSHTAWLRYIGKPKTGHDRTVHTEGRAGAVSTLISGDAELFTVPDGLMHEPCVAYNHPALDNAIAHDTRFQLRSDAPSRYDMMLEHRQWMVLGFSRHTLSVTQLPDDGLSGDVPLQTDKRWALADAPRVLYAHNEVWNTMRDRVFIHLADDGFRFIFALATSMNVAGMAVDKIQHGPMVYTFSCFVPVPTTNRQIMQRGTPANIRAAISEVFGLSMAIENAMQEARAQLARIPVNLDHNNAMYDNISLPIGHAIMSLGWGDEDMHNAMYGWFEAGRHATVSSYVDAHTDGPYCVVRSSTRSDNSWQDKRAMPITRFVEHMRSTVRILGDNRIVPETAPSAANGMGLQPVANRHIDLD